MRVCRTITRGSASVMPGIRASHHCLFSAVPLRFSSSSSDAEGVEAPKSFSEAQSRFCQETGRFAYAQRGASWVARGYAYDVFTLREEAIERVLHKVNTFMAAALYPDAELVNLSEATHLVHDLHMDTLDLIELSLVLEDEFRVSIPKTVATRFQTVGDIVDFLVARRAGAVHPDGRVVVPSALRVFVLKFRRASEDNLLRLCVFALLGLLFWILSAAFGYLTRLMFEPNCESGLGAVQYWIDPQGKLLQPQHYL